MKNSKVVRVVLFVAGLIASAIGAAIVVIPVDFYATNGITLGANIGLLNEIRASGGGLFVIGLLIISGSFIASLTFTSLVVSTLLYLSYGISRIISMMVDGMPADGLMQATAVEMITGFICFLMLIKYRSSQTINA